MGISSNRFHWIWSEPLPLDIKNLTAENAKEVQSSQRKILIFNLENIQITHTLPLSRGELFTMTPLLKRKYYITYVC